ncbi:hypothetical protein GGR50DRAFT_496971 [Xylaria sp. CBS 124048]|nr:hypothetical protein GGR50DRAFT_496971 [Xylaria sp. CBS 124048]
MTLIAWSLILASTILIVIRRRTLAETLFAYWHPTPALRPPPPIREPPTTPNGNGNGNGTRNGTGTGNDDDSPDRESSTSDDAVKRNTTDAPAPAPGPGPEPDAPLDRAPIPIPTTEAAAPSISMGSSSPSSSSSTPKATQIPTIENENENKNEDGDENNPTALSQPVDAPTLAAAITSAAAAAAAAASLPSMPPPPLPPKLHKLPTTSSLAPPSIRPPAPPASLNRARQAQYTRQPGTSTLAPPPTHSSKPSKPSRKVTLQPGRSPLDWAALASHPKSDLRGLDPGTPYLRVTPSMLRLQTGRRGKDAWTAIGGRVYNISPYLPFHPGGEPELLRAAGRDGTRLFGEIHPWVNYETMLAACLVGFLVEEGEGRGVGELEAMD